MDFFKIFSTLFLRQTWLSKFKAALTASILIFLTACTGGGGGEFANLENQGGADAEKVPCAITSLTPAEDATTKVASASGTKTLISANLSTSSCKSTFFLNGVKLESDSKPYVEIDSNLLVDGDNTVRIEVQNDFGSDFALTTIKKNILPSCSRTLPAVPNLNLTTGPQQFLVSGTVESDETASFSWELNGSTNAALTTLISSDTASQGQLDITGLPTQVHVISAVVGDGLDTVSCDWNVNVGVACELSAQSPASGPKVSAAGGTATTFAVTTTAASCLVTWQLNGVDLDGTSTTKTILSSQMSSGLNTLRALLNTGGVTTQKEWIVRKNLAPTCSQNPAATGSSVSVGQTLPLVATIIDGDSDTVTPTWMLNENATFSGAILSIASGFDGSGTPTSTGSFIPTEGLRGNNIIKALLNDGYDVTTCTWNISVNPACQISSKYPTGATVTIPALASTNNIFNAFPNDPACTVSWYMDGVNTGSILSVQNLASSIFGATTALKVRVFNASSSEEFTWTVSKNHAPACGVASPASPATIRIAQNTNFQTTITEADGHSLTGTWKMNGVDQGLSAYFNPSVLGTTFTGAWSPLAGQIGNNSLVLSLTDGYDSTTCSWSVQVKDQCSITTKSPSGTTLRAPYLASASNPFFVVANSSDCAITWKLNAGTIGTGNNAQSILSSALSGTNTVEAIVDNGVSSATATWTVNKNAPPICSLQAPSSNGNSINFGDYIDFSSTWTDGDVDNLTYAWKFNSTTPPGGTVSNEVSSNAPSKTAAMRFTPGLGQVGLGHLVKMEASDGYDTESCTWALDVMDPNSAQIISWSPSESVVRISSTGSQNFSVAATGTGNVYSWKIDGVTQAGATLNSFDLDTAKVAALGTGNHTLVVRVVDTYGTDDEHTFNIRKNAPPTIASFAPNVNGVTNFRVNLASSKQFQVTSTDANPEDTLAYTWYLSNNLAGELEAVVGSTHIANLAPGGNTSLLGAKKVKVVVSDGLETNYKEWDVSINTYSDECNALFNESPVGTSGGRVCTLVGNPSMGHGDDLSGDLGKLKSQPWTIKEIETGVYAIGDILNHTVIIYNTSGSSITRFNHTIANNASKVVVGSGAPGRSSGDQFAFVSDGDPAVSLPRFKLNSPRGFAYDSTNQTLFISDSENHRVLSLDSTGRVFQILGTNLPSGSPGTTGTNIAGEDGPDHVCQRPAGLAINVEGGIRYLYVACSRSFAIKKVNIQTPTNDFDNTTYLDTVVAVGRLNSANATAEASRDGLSGSGASASAMVAHVWALAKDESGNIYWTEKHDASTGQRVRMLNTTGSSVTISSTLHDRRAHGMGLLYVGAEDTALAGAWTAQGAGSKYAVVQSGLTAAVVDKMDVRPPAFVLSGSGCYPVVLWAKNAGGSAIKSSAPITLTPSIRQTNATGAAFGGISYFDTKADCDATSNVKATFTLGTNEFYKTIWFKGLVGTAGTHYFRVDGTTNYNTLAFTLQTAAVGATGNQFSFIMTNVFDSTACVPIVVQSTNGTALHIPSGAGTTRRLRLRHNNIGTFFSDETCSSVIDSVSFAQASSEYYKVVYYNRSTIVPSGYVASVYGADGQYNNYPDMGGGANTPSTCTTCRNLGDIRIHSGSNGWSGNNISGLAIKSNGSGFAKGIYLASELNAITYTNLDDSDTYIGSQLIKAQSSVVIGGRWLSNTYDGAYNGSNQSALGSGINRPRDIQMSLDGTKLLLADTDNLLGRYIDICHEGASAGASLCKIQDLFSNGEGRGRSGSLAGDATEAILNGPFKMEIHGGYLYFSESFNHRIRKMNIATGVVESVAGVGYSGGTPAFNDNADKDSANVIYPRGFKIIDWPTSSPETTILVYAQGGTVPNTSLSGSCLIRAINIGSSTANNFFGKTILPGRVFTIAGDTMNGCGAWSAAPNTEGGLATDNRLNSPEDIALIGGELYITNFGDDCIVKVDTNGYMVRPQGVASCPSTPTPTLPLANASFTSALVRAPLAFAQDPEEANNYLFTDFTSQQVGVIRYINNTTRTNIPFRSAIPAKASEGNPPYVSQLFQEDAGSSNTSRINGLAVWKDPSNTKNNLICWATGNVSTNYWAPSAPGDHYIRCEPRNCTPGVAGCPQTVTIGNPLVSGLKIQSGGPLAREQENLEKVLATFHAPTGLVFDSEGNLLITDFGNHVIRMVRKWW